MNFLFGIQGRIGRLQWWGAQLILFGIITVPILMFVGKLSGLSQPEMEQVIQENLGSGLVAFLLLYVLCLWINVATTVKRYHDRNKSGFWFLIVLVPVIGGLWQLIECGFLSGTAGGNSYGRRRGGNSFGDYLDNGEGPESAEVGAIRRSRTQGSSQAPAAGRNVQSGSAFGKPAAAGFGKRVR